MFLLLCTLFVTSNRERRKGWGDDRLNIRLQVLCSNDCQLSANKSLNQSAKTGFTKKMNRSTNLFTVYSWPSRVGKVLEIQRGYLRYTVEPDFTYVFRRKTKILTFPGRMTRTDPDGKRYTDDIYFMHFTLCPISVLWTGTHVGQRRIRYGLASSRKEFKDRKCIFPHRSLKQLSPVQWTGNPACNHTIMELEQKFCTSKGSKTTDWTITKFGPKFKKEIKLCHILFFFVNDT